MQTKKCGGCRKVKNIIEFWKYSDVVNYCEYCKDCVKKYYKDNPEYRREYQKEYQKEYYKGYGIYKKEYYASKTFKELRKNKYKKDPKMRLVQSIRVLINHSLKGNKNGNHWETLVNFTLQDLIAHLEKQFKPGMSWNNYGAWHIDHKIPVSLWKFEIYTDPEFKECWALDNLQPLWALENIKKGNRII